MNDKPKRKESASTPIIRVIAIVIVATVVGCGGCFAVFFGVLNTLLEPVTTEADIFLDAISDRDYEMAFEQLSFGLQARADNSPQRLGTLVLEYGAEPESWNFNNRSVENSFGELAGQVTLASGDKVPILLRLQLENDVWRVTYFEWGNVSSEEL